MTPTPVDAPGAAQTQSGPDVQCAGCNAAIRQSGTPGGQLAPVAYRKRGPHIEVLEGRHWRRVNTIPVRAVRVRPER